MQNIVGGMFFAVYFVSLVKFLFLCAGEPWESRCQRYKAHPEIKNIKKRFDGTIRLTGLAGLVLMIVCFLASIGVYHSKPDFVPPVRLMGIGAVIVLFASIAFLKIKVGNPFAKIDSYDKALQTVYEGHEVVGWWIGKDVYYSEGFRAFRGTWIWPWKKMIFLSGVKFINEVARSSAGEILKASLFVKVQEPRECNPDAFILACERLHWKLTESLKQNAELSAEQAFIEMEVWRNAIASDYPFLTLVLDVWYHDKPEKRIFR